MQARFIYDNGRIDWGQVTDPPPTYWSRAEIPEENYCFVEKEMLTPGEYSWMGKSVKIRQFRREIEKDPEKRKTYVIYREI